MENQAKDAEKKIKEKLVSFLGYIRSNNPEGIESEDEIYSNIPKILDLALSNNLSSCSLIPKRD